MMRIVTTAMTGCPGSGWGTPEDLQSRVTTCESRRCMTCAHMVVGYTFVSVKPESGEE